MTVIERIIEVIDKKGFNQKDVCDQTGISQSTLSGWKKFYRNVPTDKVIAIADYLNVSLTYLLTGKGSIEVKHLSDQEEELLRIFNSLSMKDKTALLSRAYELEEQNK